MTTFLKTATLVVVLINVDETLVHTRGSDTRSWSAASKWRPRHRRGEVRHSLAIRNER